MSAVSNHRVNRAVCKYEATTDPSLVNEIEQWLRRRVIFNFLVNLGQKLLSPRDRSVAAYLAVFFRFFFAALTCGVGGVCSILRSTSSRLGENRSGRRSGLV